MNPNDPPNNTHSDPEQRHAETERTPLLSAEGLHRTAHRVWPKVQKSGKSAWSWVLGALNPPLIAAIVAIAFGIIPPIRHAFFDNGKLLNATITQSIDYLGKLYTALQIFVLGSKLRSKPGAKFPVAPAIALFFHRFVLMPAVMISLVYLLRVRWPNYVERDPMLDFVLSIVGIGPPAVTLAAISEMAGLDTQEDAQVARILTIASQRLQSLYSDLAKKRISNPAGYTSNVEWWRRTLSEVTARGLQPAGVLVLRADSQLVDEFRWGKVGQPLGVGYALTSLSTPPTSSPASAPFIPLARFLALPHSIYLPESGLAYRVASAIIGQPLWWALQQAGLAGSDDVVKETWGDFVILANVEASAKAVSAAQRAKGAIGPSAALYTFASFRQQFGTLAMSHSGASLSETDVRVLVKHLERDHGCVVVDKQADVIKFVEEGSSEQETITSIDKGILEMSITATKLQEQVDEIQRRIEERAEKINSMLRKKQNDLALSLLRSRKQLEALLKLRLGALETVQSALMKVETAAGDVAIMKAYETSTATLKELLADPRLQREHIDQTMENMADALADHKEVEDAIALGGVPSDPTEDEELASELQALVEENEREAKEAQAAKEREAERAREEKVAAELERLKLQTPIPTERPATPYESKEAILNDG
ncbi:hypothetical protein FRC07_014581 [Ceratobasidium sp. 392]|nr:hypothetical protein FRC07_014581 [Ceratobasidium sp. 392]